MTPTRMLLLEAAGPEAGALVAAAAAAGIETYAATHPARLAVYDQHLRASLAGCLPVDFSCPDTAVRDVVHFSSRTGIGGILTTTEFLTPLVARACADLGLPGNDPVLAAAARDKARMHEQFTEHGVTTPRTVVLQGEGDLVALLQPGVLGFPLVLKPVDGAGSRGVTVARDRGEAVRAYRHACDQDRQPMRGVTLDGGVLAQEYVGGTEYSVESITQAGRTTHLCVTSKIVTRGAHRVELGHSVPAPLGPAEEAIILREVGRAIQAAGIRNCCSHTEVKLTGDGRCVVIEIGARPAAGLIGFLVELALGVEFWKTCLDVALGRPMRPPVRSRHGYATVRFLTSPRSGRLTRLANLPVLGTGVPIVRVRSRVGDQVHTVDGNAGRLGSFVVVGTDRDAVDRHADHLLSQVRIEVVPDRPDLFGGHPAAPPGGTVPVDGQRPIARADYG